VTEALFGEDGQPTFVPSTPYAGTSGWSGSDTSETAEVDRRQAQRATLALIRERQSAGACWYELADRYGWHHGIASGALSTLHKDGRLARLTETRVAPGGRRGCKVYVLPEWVGGRDTEPHGSARKPAEPAEEEEQ
jgi:hypothetical protein